jgi:GLPGLI family protein
MTNEYVITSEKTPFIEWKILDEAKLIKSYKCYKAVSHFRGRNYTAWFTTDIKIIDAPWKFYGLPGLIMDIYDEKFQVKIYVESIEYPSNSQVDPFFAKGTKISLQEYFSFKNNEMIKKNKALESLLSNQEDIDKTNFRPTVRMRGALFGIEKRAD